MTCILLAAGLGTRLETEIDDRISCLAGSDHYRYLTHPLRGVPKALLPAQPVTATTSPTSAAKRLFSREDNGFRNLADKSSHVILDRWMDEVRRHPEIRRTVLVVNALKYKYYERWATSTGFPLEHIICNGATLEQHATGGLLDLEMAIRAQGDRLVEPIVVISADMAFDVKFDLKMLLDFFLTMNVPRKSGNHTEGGGDVLAYHYVETSGMTDDAVADLCSRRGILEVDEGSKRITTFVEKRSSRDAAHSRLRDSPLRVSVVLYILRLSTTHNILRHVDDLCQKVGTFESQKRSLGEFFSCCVASPTYVAFGVSIPVEFFLIGSNVSFADYIKYYAAGSSEDITEELPRKLPLTKRHTKRCYARVGLMGNPSDQLNGKSLAVTVSNFWAEVSVFESASLRLIPNSLSDPCEFGNLRDLHAISSKEGYMGGLRLIQAACKRFFEHCSKHGIPLPRKNFTLGYETNIPRQVGLAGSSCIVSCVMKCLMEFYNLSWKDIPKHVLPSVILAVETDELGIHAGLMDRVAQVYEGLVHMDFEKSYLDANGYAKYKQYAADILPPLHLAYAMDPSDSGKIHSNVKERWKQGDTEVHAAASTWAGFVDDAIEALESRDYGRFADLMDKNFDLRRTVYGDQCLGWKNLRMIEIARSFKAAAKFPGSGGAILICCRPSTNVWEMRKVMEREGFVLIPLVTYSP